MQSRKSDLLIGTVAERTGLGVETIRYYEKVGVIRAPMRGRNGYRIYSIEHIERLGFIKRCRELGFSLEQTSSLLGLADFDERTCRDVSAIAETRLNEVRTKIVSLQRIEAALESFVESCPRDASSDCPIISALSNVE